MTRDDPAAVAALAALDRHGPSLETWPAAEREAFQRAAAQDRGLEAARAAAAAAAAALRAPWPDDPPPAAVIGGVLARLEARRGAPSAWAALAALGAAAAVGAAAFYAGVDVGAAAALDGAALSAALDGPLVLEGL